MSNLATLKKWKKGESGNPAGRPKGSRNFSTIMDEAVKELAKFNKISEAEAWGIMLRKGFNKASSGDYNFYRDTLDRYFGKPKESLDVTSGGEKIEVQSGLSGEELTKAIKDALTSGAQKSKR